MRAVLRPRVLAAAAAALVLAAVVGTWFWLDRPRVVNTDIFGVAIRGYDPVAYFTEGRARKGTRDFEVSWEGARWRFASAAHRDLFAADPERYAPQYGGHCSAALQAGQIASADPEAWIIISRHVVESP
jgi:hypothetical protein